MKTYQINYVVNGIKKTEFIEAVNRKQARKLAELLGIEHVNTSNNVINSRK